MTLLIAGYQFRKASRCRTADRIDPSDARKLDGKPSGVFIVADSAITSDSETLLSGFRKIYPVTVKLWKPYFRKDQFDGYRVVQQEFEVIVGFAGNTLIAQHYLNGLTEHLGKLRLSCNVDSYDDRKYEVIMDCETNVLETSRMAWDEHDFVPHEVQNLLTAEKISEVAMHSFQHSLRSAKKHKISLEGLKRLITPFVVGIQCPVSKEYQIYIYRMQTEMKEGVHHVHVKMFRLGHDDVAVLGMEAEFSGAAQAAYGEAKAAGLRPSHAMFDFLCASIDKVVGRGDKEVSHPAIMKTLVNGPVETVKRSHGT